MATLEPTIDWLFLAEWTLALAALCAVAAAVVVSWQMYWEGRE